MKLSVSKNLWDKVPFGEHWLLLSNLCCTETKLQKKMSLFGLIYLPQYRVLQLWRQCPKAESLLSDEGFPFVRRCEGEAQRVKTSVGRRERGRHLWISYSMFMLRPCLHVSISKAKEVRPERDSSPQLEEGPWPSTGIFRWVERIKVWQSFLKELKNTHLISQDCDDWYVKIAVER